MSAIEGSAPATASRELPPSGTVTFAFTDIEGSTQRWDRDRDAMQAAVRRHDALVRAAIVGAGGYVFKTVGDAFCATFARPDEAIAGMIAAQSALAGEDFSAVGGIRIRAAIHTGTADERDGDYFGPAVNRVARLLSITHAAQILVSGATAGLVASGLPAGTGLLDLGEHRLKDLARPERVFQLTAPELPGEFPPLRSLDALPNNLPRMLSTFVGREREIAEISTLIDAYRLVTLVGSGGLGKTRTALQVAANLLDGSGDGVWFIELAPLANGAYIVSAVAHALGITLVPDGDPLDNLVREVRSMYALLVFDNCEHLIAEAARVVTALLRGCPKLKILSSSRQPLGLAGERTYRMPSLPLPDPGAETPLTALDATRFAAIALFVERARAVDNRFALSADNASTIAEICRRLDGIPLAIELAAARSNILTPRQLRERLDERFRVLTGGSRDALPRQQTLRALIDWSYDLLDERERIVFRRLGIFVNGFALEGAAAVGGCGELDELDVFDVLASLVDKSLVLTETAGDAVRYRLLETTRVYALEKLRAAGEADAAAGRHLRYLSALFARARQRAAESGRHRELDDVAALELEDLRAALDAALTGPDTLAGAELVADVSRAWSALGLDVEGLKRDEAFLAALPDAPPLLRARLTIAVARQAATTYRGSLQFHAAADAVALARTAGDRATLAEALAQYIQAAAWLGKLDGAAAALAEVEALGEHSAELRLLLLNARTTLSLFSGDRDGAAATLEILRAENRALGNAHGERLAALNLADVEHGRGATAHAIAIVNDVLPDLRGEKDRAALGNALANLAGYRAAVDDLPGAFAAAREAIAALAPHEPDSALVAAAIEHLALTLALCGDSTEAALLAGYADAAYDALGIERQFTELVTRERLLPLLRDRHSPAMLARLFTDGAAFTPQGAIARALELQVDWARLPVSGGTANSSSAR